MQFRHPSSLPDLLNYLDKHRRIHYQAFYDESPRVCTVTKVNYNSKQPTRSTVVLWTKDSGEFSVNISRHLDRFRLEVKEQ